MIYNGGPIWTHNLFIGWCGYLKVYNNTIQKLKPGSYHAVMIRGTSYLDFYNNIVTYNDDQAVRFDFDDTQETNIRFFNNNISNNQGTGINVYGRYSMGNYLEITNNVFYSNSGYGISIAKMLNYVISNNIVTGSSGGFIDATQNGDFSNNTFKVTGTSFYIRDTYGSNTDTFFETVNCTYDPSTVWLTQGYATLLIKNFLHVKVTDVNGPAPNVEVVIKNSYDNNTIKGKTDNDGYIRYIKLINQTQKNTVSGTEYTYFDPYNLTATSHSRTAYGEIEPIMDKSQTVNINFKSDLPPEVPKNLIAESNGTNVDLSWIPSHSPDLNYYLVYRNGTGSNWVEVYNSTSNPPQQTWSIWTDVSGAQNWSTYRYKVVAVDTAFQKSSDSNPIKRFINNSTHWESYFQEC
jgi:hypothetical protein